MPRLNCLAIVFAFFVLCLHLGAAPLYVATNGPSTPPYDTWAKASSNIEWAVNAGTNGDTVWISNGVYVLTNQITVISNITISGIETGAKPVVDGNNAGRCFEFTSAATGTLANLTIIRGYTNGDGGGVYMRYCSVRDCIFSNNIATNRGGGLMLVGGTNIVQRCTFIENKAKNGGGVYLVNTLNSLIDDCSFQTNIAFDSGGGMYGYDTSQSYTIITNCDFMCNVATNTGGGLYVSYMPSVNGANIISHCTFLNNIAVTSDGGGMWLRYDCLVSNCYVSNNIAAKSGGGIQMTRVTIKNSIIARNTSQNQAALNQGGGGIHMNSGLVQDCIIEENTAGTYAGGVYFAGGTLRNCLIRNNVVSDGINPAGGGMRVFTTSADIQSCTIVSNYAKWGGGGIHNSLGATYTARVDNCIIYFNKSTDRPAASNLYDQSASSSYSNCCVAGFGEAAAVVTAACITAEPQCVDWTNGNYRLSRNSRCVNAGVYREWMNGSVDLDGHTRIDKFSGIIDIGCYEYLTSGTMFGFH